MLKAGTVLDDKWVVLELIGKGGMGEVYRAHQLNLKRDVAIKVISQEWLQSLGGDEEEIETGMQRFRREVQAMAQIRHPNILQTFDYGSTSIKKDKEDVLIEYIVMEYVPGATLRFTMSEEGFYPDDEAVRDWLVEYFLAVLDGVEAVHTLGIVHRDLKPENVLLDGTIPKITDFGLARSVHMAPVTQSVDIKGTMPYMSPEHFLDFKQADQRADIYSLGKILFEAVDGKISPETIPFRTASLSKPDTSFLEQIDRIIQDTTAEEKERRPESVTDLRKNLLRAIESLGSEARSQVSAAPGRLSFISRPKWIWTGIVIAVVSMAAMGLWHLVGEPGKGKLNSERPQISSSEVVQPDLSSTAGGSTSPTTPDQSAMGEDGLTMLLIPGGDLRISEDEPESQSGTVHVAAFYLDETKVTNQHFTEFLNSVKDTLTVESGVVKKDGEIWLYLGEGREPHEQIIYRRGRFHIREAKYAAHPVVRVTWYGASAYAQHYKKRLPTLDEWQRAALGGSGPRQNLAEGQAGFSGSDSEGIASGTGGHMMGIQHPTGPAGSNSVRSQPSRANIFGLEEMGGDIKEWVTRLGHEKPYPGGTTPAKEKATVPSLVMGHSFRLGPEWKSFRYPWEGFPDVGFRCARSVDER